MVIMMKDKKLLSIVTIITMIGLLMVYSASHIWALYKFDDSLYFIKRQAVFVFLGFICLFIFSKIDYHLYQKHSLKILVISFLSLHPFSSLFPPFRGRCIRPSLLPSYSS